ncbi:hypothetical protein AB0C90_27020 [Streptomyces sp. NPDC048550]|uniref:hypothetical protein n=1 Tax=Streptomyces sp. NPDC048550 TaxID=3155739 RepID=UPI003430CDA1
MDGRLRSPAPRTHPRGDSHALLHKRVRDIASGAEGELMAVIREDVSDTPVRERWVHLAYVRGPSASGHKWTATARASTTRTC